MLPPDMLGELAIYHNMYQLREPNLRLIPLIPPRVSTLLVCPIFDREKGGRYQLSIRIEGRACTRVPHRHYAVGKGVG